MSKREMVKQHLREKKRITSWEAIQLYKVTRLAAYIHQFKNEGMIIDSIDEKNKGDERTHALYMHVFG